MTSLVLATVTNRTVASISKPVCPSCAHGRAFCSHFMPQSVILPPKSSLLSLRKPSTVVHHVQLLKDFVPGATRLLASVEIGRKDMWRSLGRGEGREVTIFDAYLVGDVRLSGIRYARAALTVFA